MALIGALLMAVFLVLLAWLLVAEGISHVLFDAEFLVAGGSNSLSDSQDSLVGWLAALPIAIPVLGWIFWKRRRRELLKQKQEEIDRFGWAPQGQAVTPGLRPGVRARMPRDADDFESASAEWVQSCGVNARRTPKGPDGGLDLIGPSFAGQCKFHPSNKVGAPDVQQLAGAARQAQKTDMAFFHYGPGYTPAAIEAARSLGVQLWEMDVDQHTFRKVT